MLGNNIITRTSIKLSNYVLQSLYDNLKIHPDFTTGVISGFISSFWYNRYVNPLLKSLFPLPASTAADVVSEAAEHTAPNLNVLAAPGAIALFFDDHFLCGDLVGAGLAFSVTSPAISTSLVLSGAVCEYYYSTAATTPLDS